MEFYLDIEWRCCLCHQRSETNQRSLCILNKFNDIIRDVQGVEWIRCHFCFSTFHLRCIASRDGDFFDEKIIFGRGEMFKCSKCVNEDGMYMNNIQWLFCSTLDSYSSTFCDINHFHFLAAADVSGFCGSSMK